MPSRQINVHFWSDILDKILSEKVNKCEEEKLCKLITA